MNQHTAWCMVTLRLRSRAVGCSCGRELDDRHHDRDSASSHSSGAASAHLPSNSDALHRHISGAQKVRLPGYTVLDYEFDCSEYFPVFVYAGCLLLTQS